MLIYSVVMYLFTQTRAYNTLIIHRYKVIKVITVITVMTVMTVMKWFHIITIQSAENSTNTSLCTSREFLPTDFKREAQRPLSFVSHDAHQLSPPGSLRDPFSGP